MTDPQRDVAERLIERLSVLVQTSPGSYVTMCRVCDADLLMDGHDDDCPVPEVEAALLREPSEGREPDWEKCGRCGLCYPEVYWADDDQWARVVGSTFGGLRCLACFCELAQDAGLAPKLVILAPSLAMRGGTPSDSREPDADSGWQGLADLLSWFPEVPEYGLTGKLLMDEEPVYRSSYVPADVIEGLRALPGTPSDSREPDADGYLSRLIRDEDGQPHDGAWEFIAPEHYAPVDYGHHEVRAIYFGTPSDSPEPDAEIERLLHALDTDADAVERHGINATAALIRMRASKLRALLRGAPPSGSPAEPGAGAWRYAAQGESPRGRESRLRYAYEAGSTFALDSDMETVVLLDGPTEHDWRPIPPDEWERIAALRNRYRRASDSPEGEP